METAKARCNNSNMLKSCINFDKGDIGIKISEDFQAQSKYDLSIEDSKYNLYNEFADNDEILDIPMPFKTVGLQSSLTNINILLKQSAVPSPSLTQKQIPTLQLNEGTHFIMSNEMYKMKTCMEKLQDLLQQFSTTERFKQDVDFIINNIGSMSSRSDETRKINRQFVSGLKHL
ncbi:hypothetical protein FQA39_LY10056 [Lamprigera yunnana]|nr:hypothetical protein FQA39_LY10056 [Lamprigera yunnana]